jgi:hypothetical protein
MNWRDELKQELSNWDRIHEYLSNTGQSDSWLATTLDSELRNSISKLHRLHKAAELDGNKQLGPLWSYIFDKDADFEPRDRALQNIQRLGLIRTLLHDVLTSPEPHWVERVELAFIHLQRLLAADDVLRKKWKDRWTKAREPELEALGAIQLLQHQLFGFKARSTGAETDQIIGTSLGTSSVLNTDDAIRSGSPLVLTEWKKVLKQKDTNAKLNEARRQLQKYPTTAATSLELRRTRFAVLVSMKELAELQPFEELSDGSRMRIVNITIEPSSVSVQAKKK